MLSRSGELPDDGSREEIADRFDELAQIEEGLADLDAGRVAPHEQVMREATEMQHHLIDARRGVERRQGATAALTGGGDEEAGQSDRSTR